MRRHTRSTVFATSTAILAGVLVSLAPGVASAEPVEQLFTDQIDRYADYDGADSCSPTDKPGAIAYKNLVLAAYPGTTASISRACDSGSSEHYEGRAIDWMISAATQRALADDLFRWLFADDSYGNENAMVRRLGLMYIIWDHRIWRAYSAEDGWQPYTGSNPHTDHVHVSLSWDGALERTTWFTGAEIGMRLDQARFAATWHKTDRLDVFRRGQSGALQSRSWSGAWGTWEDLGGDLSSSPAAVWARNDLWVFARGSDGTLLQRRWRESSGWQAWEETGVDISAAPGVASRKGRVDLVVRTPTGSVEHRAWKVKSGWTSWEDLGGIVTAPPTVLWQTPTRLEVFVRGATGTLYQKSMTDGIWSGWIQLGGVLTSGPAATSMRSGEADVYVRTTTGSISHRYDTGAGWSSWFNLGGRHVSGPTVSSIPDDAIDVFTRVRSGDLNQNTYRSGTGWSGWMLP